MADATEASGWLSNILVVRKPIQFFALAIVLPDAPLLFAMQNEKIVSTLGGEGFLRLTVILSAVQVVALLLATFILYHNRRTGARSPRPPEEFAPDAPPPGGAGRTTLAPAPAAG
jgi:hypothetical protein